MCSLSLARSMVRAMLKGENEWRAVSFFCSSIMKQKEEAERERERRALASSDEEDDGGGSRLQTRKLPEKATPLKSPTPPKTRGRGQRRGRRRS